MKKFLYLLLLTSCVSVNITSNKAENYSGKLSKVYIYYYADKAADEFLNTYSSGLSSQFSQLGIQSRTEIRNPLSLDSEEDVYSRINNYRPSHLMLYKLTKVTYSNGFIVKAEFEISIIDSGTKKIIWKSVMDSYGANYLRDAANKSIERTIEKLKIDGII